MADKSPELLVFVQATLLSFTVVCNVLLIRLCFPEENSYNPPASKGRMDTNDSGIWKKHLTRRAGSHSLGSHVGLQEHISTLLAVAVASWSLVCDSVPCLWTCESEYRQSVRHMLH